MNKFNLLVHLQAFADANPANSPTMNFFKWQRDIASVDASKPSAMEFILAPGESKELFSGERVLSHDNTTVYDLALKSGTSNYYILSHNSGTAPLFRTPRNLGQDSTTQLIVSKNGSVVTLTQGIGTAINTSSIVVGDKISLGLPFDPANRGLFTVIAKTATSISFENGGGEPETVVLGAGYDTAIEVFSASGVQVGDNLRIYGGFSSSSHGTYEITKVYANRIEFFSSKALAEETVITDDLAIYFMAKQFLYLESNKKVSLTINNVSNGDIEPFVCGTHIQPGMFLKKSTMWSCTVTNISIDPAQIFVASIE